MSADDDAVTQFHVSDSRCLVVIWCLLVIVCSTCVFSDVRCIVLMCVSQNQNIKARLWPSVNVSVSHYRQLTATIPIELGTFWYRVSWYQNVKPFWILMQHEMLDVSVMQIRTLETYKPPVRSPLPEHQQLSCLHAGCPSCHPTNSVKALTGKLTSSVIQHIHCWRQCGSSQPEFSL